MAVANLEDNKTAVNYKKTLEKSYDPLYKQIKGMDAAIGFYDLNLKWNSTKKAWRSVGKLGVSNIGKNDISTYIDGIVEIKNTQQWSRCQYLYCIDSKYLVLFFI